MAENVSQKQRRWRVLGDNPTWAKSIQFPDLSGFVRICPKMLVPRPGGIHYIRRAMPTDPSSRLVEFLRAVIPQIDGSWPFTTVDIRTWRRWRDGDNKPTERSARAVGQELWKLMEGSNDLRKRIQGLVQRFDPNARLKDWTKPDYVVWIQNLAQPDPDSRVTIIENETGASQTLHPPGGALPANAKNLLRTPALDDALLVAEPSGFNLLVRGPRKSGVSTILKSVKAKIESETFVHRLKAELQRRKALPDGELEVTVLLFDCGELACPFSKKFRSRFERSLGHSEHHQRTDQKANKVAAHVEEPERILLTIDRLAKEMTSRWGLNQPPDFTAREVVKEFRHWANRAFEKFPSKVESSVSHFLYPVLILDGLDPTDYELAEVVSDVLLDLDTLRLKNDWHIPALAVGLSYSVELLEVDGRSSSRWLGQRFEGVETKFFDHEQVQELAGRLGVESKLSDEPLKTWLNRCGGQPHLVHAVLWQAHRQYAEDPFDESPEIRNYKKLLSELRDKTRLSWGERDQRKAVFEVPDEYAADFLRRARLVKSSGDFYFPYAGEILALGSAAKDGSPAFTSS